MLRRTVYRGGMNDLGAARLWYVVFYALTTLPFSSILPPQADNASLAQQLEAVRQEAARERAALQARCEALAGGGQDVMQVGLKGRHGSGAGGGSGGNADAACCVVFVALV